jgi:hypothetical protein
MPKRPSEPWHEASAAQCARTAAGIDQCEQRHANTLSKPGPGGGGCRQDGVEWYIRIVPCSLRRYWRNDDSPCGEAHSVTAKE